MKKKLLFVTITILLCNCEAIFIENISEKTVVLLAPTETSEVTNGTIQFNWQKVLADKQIDIAKLTPFDWEQLYIFKPYTPISIIDSKLGYIWSGAEKTFINQEEEFDLLIFTKNDTVVNYIRWFRNKGDFSKINQIKYQPANAKFIYKKEKFGEEDWLFLYEKK